MTGQEWGRVLVRSSEWEVSEESHFIQVCRGKLQAHMQGQRHTAAGPAGVDRGLLLKTEFSRSPCRWPWLTSSFIWRGTGWQWTSCFLPMLSPTDLTTEVDLVHTWKAEKRRCYWIGIRLGTGILHVQHMSDSLWGREDGAGMTSSPRSSQIPASVKFRVHELTTASISCEDGFEGGGWARVTPTDCIGSPR